MSDELDRIAELVRADDQRRRKRARARARARVVLVVAALALGAAAGFAAAQLVQATSPPRTETHTVTVKGHR